MEDNNKQIVECKGVGPITVADTIAGDVKNNTVITTVTASTSQPINVFVENAKIDIADNEFLKLEQKHYTVGKSSIPHHKDFHVPTPSQSTGQRIRKVETLPPINITYKDGSVFGFGGNHSHTYKVYVYMFENGAKISLFCFDTMNAPDIMIISNELQYGLQNGKMFLVLHDKRRKIFQHRFVASENPLTVFAQQANQHVKYHFQLDVGCFVGDLLRDF